MLEVFLGAFAGLQALHWQNNRKMTLNHQTPKRQEATSYLFTIMINNMNSRLLRSNLICDKHVTLYIEVQ